MRIGKFAARTARDRQAAPFSLAAHEANLLPTRPWRTEKIQGFGSSCVFNGTSTTWRPAMRFRASVALRLPVGHHPFT